MTTTEAPRRERLLLAAIALGAAVPMLYMAVHQRIDYDSWWHVFIARTDPWAQFWQDVQSNAHPPVFYLLLRVASWMGTDRLVYRALPLSAAVAAIYLLGRVATRVFRTSGVALLCALSFGIAMTTVTMACAVRSYMLSVAFVLVAFRLYLILIDPRRERIAATTGAWFTVALSAAIATHYAAIFFACAAAALPVVYAAIDRPYRIWLRERVRTHWRAHLALLVAIAAVVVAAYVVHLSRFAAPMSHTAPFYPDALESAAGWVRGSASFLARSVVAEIDLFSPVPIAPLPAAVRAGVVGLLAVLAAGLLLTLRRRADWVVAAAPLVLLALLAGVLMGAALLGRYPFGGFLRHQFILFPFLMLATFALVDEVAARLTRGRLFLAALGVAVVLKCLLQWGQVRLVDVEPGAAEVAQFDQYLGDSGAVYVDRFSLIPFMASQQRHTWSAQREVGEHFVVVPVQRSERTLLVMRDTTRWNCDLTDPRLYRDLRALLERTGLASIDIFRLRQDAHLLPPAARPERAALAESVVRLAAGAGLRVERLILDGLHVYARLRPATGARE